MNVAVVEAYEMRSLLSRLRLTHLAARTGCDLQTVLAEGHAVAYVRADDPEEAGRQAEVLTRQLLALRRRQVERRRGADEVWLDLVGRVAPEEADALERQHTADRETLDRTPTGRLLAWLAAEDAAVEDLP